MRKAAFKLDTSKWPSGSKLLSHKGYSIPKSILTPEQEKAIRTKLTVKPYSPPPYDTAVEPFPVYFESTDRLYLPRDWAMKALGEPDKDIRSEGLTLREELAFTGSLRDEQLPIVNTFLASDANGLICVPCGYGKTYMAIWIAMKLKKRFLVVVHKEFLLSQWKGEIERLIPGVRLGLVQGNTCTIGEAYDGALVMIQTLCNRDYNPNTFKDFGFAIFDECHHLGAEHFMKSLLKIQCKHMLGLSATPERKDKLTDVFIWFLGPITYRIKHRDADESVRVLAYRFEAADESYTKQPVNYRGEIIRARLLNQIAEYKPRTVYLSERLATFWKEGRTILILSDRREHLNDFETELKKLGVNEIGYYVGGMKQVDLDASAEKRMILATFAMAAEAMNIPALNTVLLATPKSDIEQSVGRILREKKETRKFPPLIMDVIDHMHHGCIGQYNRRRNYYKACGYKVSVLMFGQKDADDSSESDIEENKRTEPPKQCLLD